MKPDDLPRLRKEYESAGIDPDSLSGNPVAQFETWLAEAIEARVMEPNAMVIATVDGSGTPRTRFVLAKGVTEGGVEFYTNYHSNKAGHLGDRGPISATFGWLELHRQVHMIGTASKLTAEESDAYFAIRPRESQLGAWASEQSQVIADRAVLDSALTAAAERFPSAVPRPPHWGGYRIVPTEIEFWQGRPNRLHDRVRYRISGGSWDRDRLSP